MHQGYLSNDTSPQVPGEEPFTFQAPFRPPTGPWPDLPRVRARWLRKRVEGERRSLQLAASILEDEIESGQGSRFEMSSRKLGFMMGMSQSTGSRCLRDLRRLGIIALWRKHTVRYVTSIRRWIGKAAVHELSLLVRGLTHPYGDERGSPPIGVSQPPSPGKTPPTILQG